MNETFNGFISLSEMTRHFVLNIRGYPLQSRCLYMMYLALLNNENLQHLVPTRAVDFKIVVA